MPWCSTSVPGFAPSARRSRPPTQLRSPARRRCPDSTGTSSALASQYLASNGGGAGEFNWTTTNVANDTISVKVTREADGVFAKLFGINSVEVHAKAIARSGNPDSARFAAPIAVDRAHPLLNCHPRPCFNEATTLDLEKTGAGAFRLLNLDQSHGGTGGKVDYGWIVNGYDGYMPLGWYGSDPASAFNDKKFKERDEPPRRGRVAAFPSTTRFRTAVPTSITA